jgi:hypothetical protein
VRLPREDVEAGRKGVAAARARLAGTPDPTEPVEPYRCPHGHVATDGECDCDFDRLDGRDDPGELYR